MQANLEGIFASRRLLIYGLAVMLAVCESGRAQTVWASAAAGNWNTAASWNPGVVPGVGTNASIIVAGTFAVTYNSVMSAPSIASLTLGSGSSIPTLTITAAGFNVAGTCTLVDSGAEVINVNSGGVMTNATLAMTSQNGTVTVNTGGVMTNSITKVADNGSTDGNSQLKINSGAVVNLGTVTVGRHTQSGSLGFNISSGTIITKSIDIGSRNSYANMVVSGGNTTNAGSLRLGTGTPTGGREMRYRQTGGTVGCAGTVDMSVAASATTWFSVVGTGATFSADGIRIFPNAVSSTVARFTNSGNIYLGGSGFKVLNSGTYTVALEDLSVLGATVDWAANVNMTTASGNITFKCADAGGTAHNITLTNPITGGAGLTKSGGGTLTLLGANTYSGSTIVSAGLFLPSNASALPKGTALTVGGTSTTGIVDLAGFNFQVSGLTTAGTAANQIITNSSSANTSTLTFSNSAASSTFGGKITGGSKPIALTILGGNLTLTNANTYAGNIFIGTGKLALNNGGSTFTGSQIVLSNSTATLDVSGMGGLTLSTGQSLSGYGVVTGSVTAANCPITPGTNGVGGTLTFTNNLTLNGNVTNQFDLLLDPSAAGSDVIVVGGALNVSGVNVLKINPLAGSLLEGTYHLFKCGSVDSGGTNNFQLVGSPGAGLQAAVSVTATGVDLVISQAGGNGRVWAGDGAANLWDFTTTNWLNAGLPDAFTNGNSVFFDDTSTNPVVTLAGAFHPTSITVDSTNNYTFTGAGKITGAISLEKTNSGTLIILTTNDYVGVTTIDAGTIQVGNGVVSGALGSGSLEDNGILQMQQPGGSTLSNAVSGTGSLIQSGTATLTLAASNTFTGGTLISSGTLQIGTGGTPGNGSVTNNSALVFNSSGNTTVNGVISGTGTVTLSGAGTVTLTAPNNYTGNTTVGAGTLLVNGTNGTSAVTVNSGGTLGGKGKIGGTVTLNSGGILSPGSTVGTLTVVSNLTANGGSVLNFAIGTTSDKVVVGGNLNLSGTLNITDAGGLGNGTYTLFTYGGSLVLNTVTFGTTPSGKLYELDTSTAGQVNLIVGVIATNVPAFPGALGFGSIVTGGRGGKVYHVTTLADSGTGSFRDAVSQSGRIIVFDVGGYISLSSAVSAQGNLTIAGQTAPGGGIGFKGGEISFAGRANVIMRYVRIRPGSDTTSSTDDALSLYTAHNVILDHCSFEFAPWNNIDGVGDSTHVITNITFQSCIIADPTGQQFGCHSESIGGTWSWIYNLFVNSHNRNPLAKTDTVFINNVEYNCSAGYTTHTSTRFKHDIINNYFIYGPASGGNFPWYQIDNNQSMYFTGNLRDTSQDGVLNGSSSVPLPGYQGGGTILGSPWWSGTTSIPTYTPQTAYRLVTSRAGTFPRDEMDTLIVNQVKTLGNAPTGTGAGTAGPGGGLYTTQTSTGLGNNGYGTITGAPAPLDSDGDAMPDYWETAVGLNANNANDATNVTLSGYSQLEVYLNWLGESHAVVAINTNLDINLSQYASGFTNVSPVYSISNVVNGTVTLLPDGHTARYVPPANFTGRASFFFKVAGSDGTSMTNTMGLVVTGVAPPQDLIWRGDGTANLWNIAITTNWINGALPAIFHTGDEVTFDDTGSNSPAINLVTALSPGSLTVASGNNYTFSGAGALAGSGALTKSGAGTLTIGTTNSSYSGNVSVNGGTLALAGGSSLGSANMSLNNGGIFSLLAGSTLAFGGSVSVGSGQSGTLSSGQLANSFSGAVTSDDAGGILNLSGGISFSGTGTAQFDGFTGVINIPSGSSLRFSANSSGNNYGSANPVFVVNGTLQPRNAGNTVLLGQVSGTGTLAGPQSNSGTGDTLYVIGGNNAAGNFGGVISSNTAVAGSNVSISKTGSGTLTLGGANTYTGATTVSNGTLVINGSTGTGALTVVNGTLGGSGAIGGSVTLYSGKAIAPGSNINSGTTGTLTIANGLSLTNAMLYFDLASATTAGGGVNDLISLSGGALILSGTTTVAPNLLNGFLSAGNYTLISGGSSTTGSAANLAWAGATGSRQTFSFNTATPGTVLLTVAGLPPATLIWSGTNGSAWDVNNTVNWLNPATAGADKFFGLDSVIFDDSSTNGNAVISGIVQPGQVTVTNAALNYTISGGVIGGVGSLVKGGSGTLTLGGSNSYSGGTFINGGMVVLNNDVASQSGLGAGAVTLNGGTLTMHDDSATFNAAAWNVIVNSTGTLNADSRCDLYGALTGGGTLNFFVPYIRTTLFGDWSSFTGTVNVISDSDGGDFRVNNFSAYPNAAISLGSKVSAYFNDVVDPAGTRLQIGELSGVSSSLLSGGATAGNVFTWQIGGRNTDATFSGNIIEQATNTITAIEKIGSGVWTLTGSNSFSGGITVSGGTLQVNNTTGSATGTNQVFVAIGATLSGSGFIGGLTALDDDAILAPGNPFGTLTISNELDLSDLTVLQFGLGTNSNTAVVSGDLNLGGQLNITNTGGFGAGTYTLFTYGGALTPGNLTIATAPAGFICAVSTNIPGQINLIVQSSAPPVFGNINLTGGSLALSGSGGPANGIYYVLTSTNMLSPLNLWTPVLTNHFDNNGNFNFTNGTDTNLPQGFYILQMP